MPARAADHGDESARTLARAGPERQRRATRRRGDVTRARMETCRSGTRLAYKCVLFANSIALFPDDERKRRFDDVVTTYHHQRSYRGHA
jgi:hypothetical protein